MASKSRIEHSDKLDWHIVIPITVVVVVVADS